MIYKMCFSLFSQIFNFKTSFAKLTKTEFFTIQISIPSNGTILWDFAKLTLQIKIKFLK